MGLSKGTKPLTFFVSPVEFIKFLDCAYPLIREFRGELREPERDPDLQLICDEEVVDPVLKIKLPPSTVEFFSREKLAVLKMGDQSKIYDLVSFDPQWHDGSLINAGIINIISPIGTPDDVADLMDQQFGGYDSYSRFNAITFTQTKTKNTNGEKTNCGET